MVTLPYSGDYLTYGMGPEHTFFGQQAPASQQAAPVIVPSWAAIVGGGGQAAGSSGTEIGGDNGIGGTGMLSTGAVSPYTGGGFNITPADWGTIGGVLGTGLSFAGLPGAGIVGSGIGNALAMNALNQEMQGMGLAPTLGARDVLGSTIGSLGMGLVGNMFDIRDMGDRFADAVDAQAQDEDPNNFLTNMDPALRAALEAEAEAAIAGNPALFGTALAPPPVQEERPAFLPDMSQPGIPVNSELNTFASGIIDPNAPGWVGSEVGQYSAGVLGDVYGTGIGGGQADPGGGPPAEGSPGGYGGDPGYGGGYAGDPGGWGGDQGGGGWGGGYGMAGGGRVLGPGDGLSDDVMATVGGQEPAMLSVDEHVIPADVVSMLGNGSSTAGHKRLKQMVDQVRMQKTGKKRQARPLKARTLGQLAA